MAEIVQGFHRIDIHAEALLPQKFCQLPITLTLFVSRDIKGQDPAAPNFLQGFHNGHPVLVSHPSILLFYNNFIISYLYHDS